MAKQFDEDIRNAINATITWLSIRLRKGDLWLIEALKSEYPSTALMADIDHSSLLARLLDGKPPLPSPPPTNHSYPWYSLIDNGWGDAYNVWEPAKEYPDQKFYQDHYTDILLIDQCAWKIVERMGHEDWIVRYGQYVYRIQRWPKDRERPQLGSNWLLEHHDPPREQTEAVPNT